LKRWSGEAAERWIGRDFGEEVDGWRGREADRYREKEGGEIETTTREKRRRVAR
jgi:hypothetical protein